MSISFEAVGTAQETDGTTTMTCPAPAGADDTSLQFLVVGYKFETDGDASICTIPDIAGWKIVNAYYGGVTRTTGDTGIVGVFVYYRYGVDASSVLVPLLNVTVVSGAAYQISYDIATTPVMCTDKAADNAHGANYSVTFAISNTSDTASRWEFENGDRVIAFTALTSSAGSISSDALNDTGGNLTGDAVDGNKLTSLGDNLVLRTVSAGGGATNTLNTYTHSNASSNSGATVMVIVREMGGIDRFRPASTSGFEWQEDVSSAVCSLRTTATQLHLLILHRADEVNFTSTAPTVPAGWTQLASIASAVGSGLGSVDYAAVAVYYRIDALDNHLTAQTMSTLGVVSYTNGSTWGVGYVQSFATTDIFKLPTGQTGSDVVSGADPSITFASNFNLDAGDTILVAGTGSYTSSSVSSITVSGMSGTLKKFYTSGTGIGNSPNSLYGPVLAVSEGLTGTESGTTNTVLSVSTQRAVAVGVKIATFTAGALNISAAPPDQDFSTIDNRYIVSVQGVDNGEFTGYNILRIDQDTSGYPAEFLAANETITDDAFTLNDFEFHFAPIDQLDTGAHYYQLDLYSGSTKLGSIASNVVTPHSSRVADPSYVVGLAPDVWIKSIGSSPVTCLPVVLEDFRGYSKSARVLGEYQILGNPYPVIITDVMGSAEGSFSVLIADSPLWVGSNQTASRVKQIEDLFADGGVCFFNTTWPVLAGIPDFYFKVRSYDVERINRVVTLSNGLNGEIPTFRVKVTWVEQERPADRDTVASATWQTLLDNYATWAQMSIANNSWLDVLIDG